MTVSATIDTTTNADERLYLASQWRLMWLKFRRHKLALIGASMLIILYVLAIFCEFFSPYDIETRFKILLFSPPTKIHFVDEAGKFHIRPFVYGLARTRDRETLKLIYSEDKTQKFVIKYFKRGDPYKILGLFPSSIRLIGVDEPGAIFLFGSDSLGRDLFSRILYGARISLSVGMVGVALSFFLGCILGGISGFYGGTVDTIIQRIIEILTSIPTIPLWMGLAAAIPLTWPPLNIYFMITIILSIVGWCGLARIVRGKLISLREEDFVLAARISNARERSIISRHLLPSFLTYLIVHLTLSIPAMILGETALSFLGLGLRPPVVSWGVLLRDAQNIKAVSMHLWLVIPGLFVIATVLAFNFLGDGLRDAADPYT